jgi:diguanylate cyclase (GGDEF)-like protein
MWAYAPDRLSAVVHSIRDPLQRTRIVDNGGQLVLDVPVPLEWPTVAAEAPFFDFGQQAGTLAVSASMRDVFEQTLLVLAFSAIFGGIVFFPLRRIPLRALGRAHAEILRREREQRMLVNGLLEGVLLVDDGLQIRAGNPSASRILGLSQARLLASRLDAVFRDPVAADGSALPVAGWPLKGGTAGDPAPEGFVAGVPLGGTAPAWLSLKIQRIESEARRGSPAIVVSFEDITERVSAQRRILELAHYDALTGLPNRSLMREMIGQAIGGARRRGGRLAVLFVDLDHFKTINDTLGHQTGDAVLAEVGRRLRDALRQEDIVARLGGDEFVAAIPDLDDPAEVAAVADKLMRRLGEPYAATGSAFQLTPSIGIALYPEDGTDIDALLSNADAAMYSVKENGRAGFRFFAPDANCAKPQPAIGQAAPRAAPRESTSAGAPAG